MKKTASLPAVTERRNPRSRNLDLRSTTEILRILNREDARVSAAVRSEIPRMARAVDAIVDAFCRGGRLIYVGAGTSGRLGVLDAAECPPTFGTPATKVKALVAGGRRAVTRAIEGAEDSSTHGARDLARARVSHRDVVVGLTASGSTPYVLGALRLARRRKAFTIGVTCNRRSAVAGLADVLIAPQVGPEAIAGSTRMKAGTAQKMVLNLLSTTAMVRMGRVYDNWMVRVALTNRKLRRRGLQVLQEAARVNASLARHTLRQAGYDLPVALVMLKTGLNAQDGRRRLAATRGDVRAALGESRSRKLSIPTEHRAR